jgi:hypothetical protein
MPDLLKKSFGSFCSLAVVRFHGTLARGWWEVVL